MWVGLLHGLVTSSPDRAAEPPFLQPGGTHAACDQSALATDCRWIEVPSAVSEERGHMTHNETNISESGPLWPDITELFQGPEDRAWAADRDRLVHDVGDPWSRRDGKPNAPGDR